jgi:7-cyano-7-deazaguanine tRNA-ribosyltransferase
VGVFEILQRDAGGRIGRLKTAHGILTTPCLLPVVNPVRLEIPVEEMRKAGVEALMTNAYIIYRHWSEPPKVHELLGFEGPIATDSGGFQILRYGRVKVGPEEIVRFQESLSPDIAVILDIPTGASDSHGQAEEKVEITLQRATEAVRLRQNPSILWAGPVQGGKYLDLVERCARELSRLDYPIHAIGGPVEYFERYHFSKVVDLVMTAKMNLPLDRPVHLFGAGHPIFFSLAVLMGCDLFDSAAYALFAKAGRYMTPEGTKRLEEMREFPCVCPACVGRSPQEVREMVPEEKTRVLALHNLYVSLVEVRKIRQAIAEGKLWEYTQRRCASHPRLLDAFRRLVRYSGWLEKFDPVTKPSGFLYVGPESAYRPEVIRHQKRLERYTPPPTEVLIIAPLGCKLEPQEGHVVKVVPPFGVIPEELSGFYPLGQYEISRTLSREEWRSSLAPLREYLEKFGDKYKKVILLWTEAAGEELVQACEPVKEKLEVHRKGEKHVV